MGRLRDLDRSLFQRVAAADPPGLGPVLPRLGRAANHGVLWLGAATALGLSRNRSARRAALRGVGSLALASTAANVVAKQLVRRKRPLTVDVPIARQLLRAPVTSSFPSGHSASAAAFATAVTLESPWLGAVAVPVAGAVAVSRIYTGAHYPADVLAGVALGAGVAALTLRWWPLRDDTPVRAAPARAATPALPDGRGLVVVVNSASGSADDGGEGLRQAIAAELPGAEIRCCGPDDALEQLLETAAEEVSRRPDGEPGALGIVGGDGSVNTAARIAARRGVPLAVFPGGTLNHFSADLGLFTLQDTAAAVRAGHGGAVDLGRITTAGRGDDRFLNTFSIGVYPELVQAREELEKYLGKWPALAVGLVRVLAHGRPTRLVIDGRPRTVWMLFAGNGRYDPPGFAPSFRRDLDDGLLDVRVVDGERPLARTRLVAAFLTGTLASSRVYRAALVERLRVDRLAGGHHARDGEVVTGADSLVLDVAARALTVYLPQR